MPLQTALDRLQARPVRILDIGIGTGTGTGTGAAAIDLADRYPDAQIVGIDVSDEMIAQARARAADLSSRVRFLVTDIAGFDLIAMLNMPPFFDKVVAVLRPGGFVVNASSYGARTPFFTPPAVLQRGFERRGLRTIAAQHVGHGTYYLAQRG